MKPLSNKKTAARRGVLLLVVLAMLVMFGLFAFAFVMLTGHAKRISTAENRKEITFDPPENTLHAALLQGLRGPADPPAAASSVYSSAIGPHSLLEDLYGRSLSGSVQAVSSPVTGGQFRKIVLNPAPTPPAQVSSYLGTLMTFTSGDARGHSLRIVGAGTGVGGDYVLVMVEDVSPSSIAVNDQYVINGIPFSGTGLGIDSSNAWNDTLALLPNDRDQNRYPSGLANEDYDAADFQNMLLALVLPPDGTNPAIPLEPSLHRAALINYQFHRALGTPPPGVSWPGGWTDDQKWLAMLQPWGSDGQPGGGDNVADIAMGNAICKWKRSFILRPLRDDHPNFDGSNPASVIIPGSNFGNSFWERNGPWDIDNDGDGIPDSVWVDIGLPVRSTFDGRLYKPMVSYLCIDMDGRLNLNAHGSTAITGSAYTQDVPGPFAGNPNSATPLSLPRGTGFGPADIDLTKVFNAAQTTALLQGSGAIRGRYGETPASSEAGWTGSTNPADNNRNLSLVKFFEYPEDYSDTATARSFGFRSPPDLWGKMAVGVDYLGQPYFWKSAWNNETQNHPYQLDLSAKGRASGDANAADSPFTPAELERLLRLYDRDASRLADRLVKLVPGFETSATLRHKVTTDSYDIPTAPANAPASGGTATIMTLLRNKLRLNAPADDPMTPVNEQDNWINARIQTLLSWDLMLNLRMDVNRPVGSGGTGLEGEFDQAWGSVFGSNVVFQFNNGVRLATADLNGGGIDQTDDDILLQQHDMARQLLARHLFVLMMLLRDEGYVQPTTESGLTADQSKELTIRRIAQWAINAVDFRDADSIMTPFEYDQNPFDGWNVDGMLGSGDDTHADRRLVWGCEAPELLLTETSAFHDRRVADTAFDNNEQKKVGGASDDNDLDQTRIPQGSAFFELFCPRGPNNSVMPSDLYTLDDGKWYLDLGKLSPPTGGVRYPVWRMAITESTRATGDPANDVSARFTAKPNSFSPETEQYASDARTGLSSLLDPRSMATPDPNLQIERIVWFTDAVPTEGAGGHWDADRTYYRQGGSALLEPGKYALVGPRARTHIGTLVRDVPNNIHWGHPSPQRIDLSPVFVAPMAYPSAGVDIQQPLGIVVAGRTPTGWTNGARIGISVSEPLFSGSYYPEPLEPNPGIPGLNDAYGDLREADANKRFPDTPLDSQAGYPLADDGIVSTGTYANYKSVLLQRLANPLKPFDPVSNPYLTVDWSPIDLTVFNGEDRAGGANDPQDTSPTEVYFATRERGSEGAGTPPNIWAPGGVASSAETTNSTRGTWNFQEELKHTLGFINEAYGMPWSTAHIPPAPAGYIGAPVTASGNPVTPDRPFPWIVWNNRPYASALELLQVPTGSAARLPIEFAMPSAATSLYNPADANASGFHVPFGHLANFFLGADSTDTSSTPAPHFFRALDYLRVPSRFLGTETILKPSVFEQDLTETTYYRPPYNLVSQFRDPGLVNINTIMSEDVWNAVKNGHAGPTFAELQESRGGYAAASSWALDPTKPSRIANPFRSSMSADWTPAATKQSRPANVTLLRAATHDPGQSNTPLFNNVDSSLHRSAARNPYFYYEGLQRLGNLVTTRSNVYAVWITVGYFEVTPADPRGYNLANASERLLWNRIYPDGYALGPELGMDTGEIKRHRAFYLIDRSIPVAFERGKDHNVEKTILVKRYIE